MNKKLKTVAVSALAFAIAATPLVGCSGTNKPAPYVESGVTVKFNFNDGDNGARPYNVVVESGSEVQKPSNPTKEGSTFTKWTTAKDGGTDVSFPVKPTASVEYFAQWEVKKCTVTYNYNYEGATNHKTVEVNYGDKVNDLVPDISRGGDWSFYRWQLGADPKTSPVKFPYPVKDNVTFYARWVDGPIYQVSLSENYGSEPATTVVKVPNGENFDYASVKKPTREGFSFVGWAESSDAAAKDILKDTYTPSSNATLYAVWKKASGTINFDYNFPDPPAKKYKTLPCDVGSTINASDVGTPTRAKFTFDGWYGNSRGGSKITFPYKVTKSTTLYAHWKSEDVQTTKFDAEFTPIDPTLKLPGYSGDATGVDIIMADDAPAGTPDSQRSKSETYPTNSSKSKVVGHYVTYLYAPNTTLTFVFNSDKAVPNAKIKLRLAYEILNTGSLTIAPKGDGKTKFQYQVKVNGTALNYAPIRITGKDVSGGGMFKSAFDDYELNVSFELKQGENKIELVTDNSDKVLSGTTQAVAPMVDRIELVESSLGGAKLFWNPIYDNIYSW